MISTAGIGKMYNIKKLFSPNSQGKRSESFKKWVALQVQSCKNERSPGRRIKSSRFKNKKFLEPKRVKLNDKIPKFKYTKKKPKNREKEAFQKG